MKSRVAHWGARELQRNLDDLVPDTTHPQAFPSTYPMDLMGRIRVKLTVEDGNLVAYGFGRQRIAAPRESVGGVYTVGRFKFGKFITHDKALLVIGRDNTVLLRADGLWETYGEVSRVAGAARIDQVAHLYPGNWHDNQFRPRSRPPSIRSATTQAVTRFRKAPGYRRLRVYPRGRTLRILAMLCLFALTMGLGGFLGVLPAAKQQITGSVWHGAPTANVISASIFTAALPPLFVFLVLRLRRLRWRRAKDMVDGLTAT